MKDLGLDKLPFGLLLLLCALWWFPVGAAATDVVHEFPRRVDDGLQNGLLAHLEKLDLSGAAKARRLAVTLVDITDPGRPRLAQVNGHEMMYAASLPKIAILFGAFHDMAAGRLKRTRRLLQDLRDMIRMSSNSAATRILNQIGPFRLNRLLQAAPYRFYDITENGGLWVGKAYGKSPAFQRDPLHSISHGATPWQVARFYYLIERGALVSPEASREMKSILGSPGIHHKFVAGLESLYPNVDIYRKSGTWRTYHSDSAIVERDGRRYIAVALANDRRGGEWLKKIIVAIDDVVFASADPLSRLQAGAGD